MKKHFVLLTGLICSLCLGSCLTSLQPLVTKENIIADNRFSGEWMGPQEGIRVVPVPLSELARDLGPQKQGEPLEGKDKEDSIFYSKGYMVSVTKYDYEYIFMGMLMKSQGQVFLSLMPIAKRNVVTREELNTTSSMATFSIARLEWNPAEDRMTFHFLDSDYIRSQILSGHLRIPYEHEPLFGTFIITASSAELQSFIGKYGLDKRFYAKDKSVELKKAG